MKRRRVLALAGGALLAGCSAERPTGTPSREPSTATAARTQESTGSPAPTETETPTLDVRHRYSFGEWHSMDKWNVTVRTLDLPTTFRVDDGEAAYEMPADQQLALATAAVENTTESRRGWSGRFGVITDDSAVYESQMAFDHPEFEDSVDVDDLQRVDHQRQFQPQALPVDPGETARVWAVAVIPRSLSRRRVHVGLETPPADVRYPVRWDV